jgi:zinc D-Ala-D-Ala carboxypeptidase
MDNKKLAEWIKENLEFDQLILEFYVEEDPQSGWVHCSYDSDLNRKQSLLAYKDDKHKTQYKSW